MTCRSREDAAGKIGKIHTLARIFSIALAVLAIDRLTKYIIYKSLSCGQSVKVLPDIFHLTLVLNKGVAFGLFREQKTFFLLVAFLAIPFIIYYVFKNHHKVIGLPLASGLILGGAVGNLIDRIRFGYVIDFLDFRVWPVFNIADSCITIGAVLLGYNILRQSGKNRD